MIHSQKIERWLGVDKITELQKAMIGWYGPPICLLDVPGSVRITSDGDFEGHFQRGAFLSAMEEFWYRIGRVRHGQMNVGFASISDALSRASSGFGQTMPIQKVGPTGVTSVTSTLWRVGNSPAAGAAGAAAPGGTAHVSTDVGALGQTNPGSGTLHLVGSDMSASVINNSLLVYDRLFSVAKTINATTTEAVTGVPSRYQSTVTTNPDYIGGNFGFIEIGGTALAATAHNWTVCTYTDQANAASTMPSLVGNSAGIVDRLDQPTNQWFVPLEAGDTGIKAWTQMQCSALVATGAINFCIGHPLGFLSFPVASTTLPFDWLTNRNQAPRVFDNACLSLLEVVKPSATATTYTGALYLTGAA